MHTILNSCFRQYMRLPLFLNAQAVHTVENFDKVSVCMYLCVF